MPVLGFSSVIVHCWWLCDGFRPVWSVLPRLEDLADEVEILVLLVALGRAAAVLLCWVLGGGHVGGFDCSRSHCDVCSSLTEPGRWWWDTSGRSEWNAQSKDASRRVESLSACASGGG